MRRNDPAVKRHRAPGNGQGISVTVRGFDHLFTSHRSVSHNVRRACVVRLSLVMDGGPLPRNGLAPRMIDKLGTNGAFNQERR
jgi:hypothetical protein